MMAFQFLGPVIASVLYVIVFQKAGLRGPWLAACAGPLVGSVLAGVMIRAMMAGGGSGMMLVPLVALPLTLLPLLILAFKSWPPVAGGGGKR
ncbi:MAG: hypothetical protein JSR87_04905 [Proteobacteria bacterium]|nr:hypothetical protein [Pseudomonadota bacterium]MBS0572591.1 hypothetical protein [Pseudomonadota bacterium]